MEIVDSQADPDPAAGAQTAAKRRARARRTEPVPVGKVAEIQPIPNWARPRGVGPNAAFVAGAGLALFDAILRSGADGGEPDFAGCLRQRLALRAAESCARLSRLREDDRALRDAEHLATGAETSPGGRLHRLFRLFAAKSLRLDEATLARAVGYLDLPEIDLGALAQSLSACLGGAPDPLAAAALASTAVMNVCVKASAVDAEILALWSADVALSSWLGWPRPVPLLAVLLLHPSVRRGAGARERVSRPRPLDDDWADTVATGYGLAVAEAHALASDLARRASKLATVAPKLRARGAARVVDMLLADDGVTPSAAAARVKMSDRAARRLFDRLVLLGAVRELTGRDSFRIYGL
jgi:Protein of unknown function (DUF1403)/HTH DNA binding domain